MTTYMRLFSIYQLQFQLDDMNLHPLLCSKGLVTPYTYILFVISCVLLVCFFLQSDNFDPSFTFLHYYSHLSCWLGSHSSWKLGNCRLRELTLEASAKAFVDSWRNARKAVEVDAELSFEGVISPRCKRMQAENSPTVTVTVPSGHGGWWRR